MIRPDFEKGNGLVPCIVQEAGTGEVLMLAYVNEEALEDRKSTRLNSSHIQKSRMPSSA